MCYLIAKDFNKRGCYALQMEHGTRLVELKEMLSNKLENADIELVTISRPTAYGEYSPYTFVKSEEEFVKMVEGM